MSSEIDIKNLRQLHVATTQGEWGSDGDAGFGYFYIWSDGKSLCIQIGCGRSPTCHEPAIAKSESNSIFIAAAHNAMPALLDELERLRAFEHAMHCGEKSIVGLQAENERLQQQVADLTKACEQYQEHSREMTTACARLRGENELRQEAAIVACEERDELRNALQELLDFLDAPHGGNVVLWNQVRAKAVKALRGKK